LPRLEMDLPPFALLLHANLHVGLGRLVKDLAAHLAIVPEARGDQLAGLDRFLYGAARLGAVLAVAEPAPRRDRLDVLEGGLQSFLAFPHQDRAHSGGVQQHASAWEYYEMPRRRGV